MQGTGVSYQNKPVQIHGMMRQVMVETCYDSDAYRRDRGRWRVRVQGGGALTAVPLPAHKVTPHDVVELRPAKGDASQPAIASGIVHRHVPVPLKRDCKRIMSFCMHQIKCEPLPCRPSGILVHVLVQSAGHLYCDCG